MRRNILRTLGVSGQGGEVSAGLVHTDLVVSTPHAVPHNAHIEQGALVQAPRHAFALNVSVFMVILQCQLGRIHRQVESLLKCYFRN